MDTPTAHDAAAPLALRVITGAVTAWAAWYLMMAVHESGHLLAALATGGRVSHLDLHPLVFSQTHLASNPEPTLVVWAGPAVGAFAPLLAWCLSRLFRLNLIRAPIAFFAGLCLLANGVYLGLGWIDRIGDTGEMLRLGTPAALLLVLGLAGCVSGIAVWHTLGPWLGLRGLKTRPALALLTASLACLAIGFVLPLLLPPAP